MLHLIILSLVALLIWQTMMLVYRLIWLAVLIVAWCVLACITAALAVIVGCHKLSQVISDWRWRRRYGEILPPNNADW
jgi:hypothetical protein